MVAIMTDTLCIFFIWSLVALGLIFFAWRLLSKYYVIPCHSIFKKLIERENPFFKNSHASVIVSHLQLFPKIKILEAGCGPGRLTIPLAKAVTPFEGNVVALDIQKSMLDEVRTKVEKANLSNVGYFQAELGQGKIPKDAYDLVLLINVLGEIPEKGRITALKELYDALKPGGILSISEMICDPHFQTKQKVVIWAETVGFVKKNVFGGSFSYTMHLEKPQK